MLKWAMVETRPYKPLILFIDLQAVYCAPPSAEEAAMMERQGAYVPTPAETNAVDDMIEGCNALAELLRGKVKIGWAAMVLNFQNRFKVEHSLEEFRKLLVKPGNTLSDFYKAQPKDGDVFVAKSENSALSNPTFMEMLEKEGYTHIYIGGCQKTECALSTALKQSVWEMFERAAHRIETVMISDLSMDTHSSKNQFRPLPDAARTQARVEQCGIRTVTTPELLAEINANLGRPVIIPAIAPDDRYET